MSEKNSNNLSDGNDGNDAASADEFAADEHKDAETPGTAVVEDQPRPRARPWLALLALIVSLSALGLSFWHWQQAAVDAGPDEALEAERSALGERVDGLERGLSDVDSRVDALTEALQDRQAGLESLEQALASITARSDSVQEELARLEDELGQRIEVLAEREGEQRQSDRELERRMLMLEAASLLRLGQERAELAADWPAAREAYRRASALLQQADDPRLSAARRELARELDALESIEGPDWLRVQARLERLSGQAHRWPRAAIAGPPASEASAEEETSAGWADSLKAVFGQLVRVRPRDSVALSDEDLDLLRRQVELRLGAAELSAARRDTEELTHHLRSARNLLTSNFDPADSLVVDAVAELDALSELSPASAPAGLGRALTELREYLDRS